MKKKKRLFLIYSASVLTSTYIISVVLFSHHYLKPDATMFFMALRSGMLLALRDPSPSRPGGWIGDEATHHQLGFGGLLFVDAILGKSFGVFLIVACL